MTDKVNEPIQLHVGYVGKNRNGDRAEIVSRFSDLASLLLFKTSSGTWHWSNGRRVGDETQEDIIGPWAEDEAEDSVDTPADYVHPTQEDYNAVMATNLELVRQLAECQAELTIERALMDGVISVTRMMSEVRIKRTDDKPLLGLT